MENDTKKIGKTTLKVAGAACVATGLVAAGAVIASAAAVGSIAEGFVMAKKAVKDIFEKTEDADIVSEVKEVIVETVES